MLISTTPRTPAGVIATQAGTSKEKAPATISVPSHAHLKALKLDFSYF
ncbi:hypothetical protein H7170_03835 [Candidatus Gracilibacteria bacterium]|nr:hypothetical protein [Candidatus Gracilibacteria bacterium]